MRLKLTSVEVAASFEVHLIFSDFLDLLFTALGVLKVAELGPKNPKL